MPRQKRSVGRPTLFTPETQRKIIAYIRGGAFPTQAARASGVGYSTYLTWMASEDPRFAEFQDNVATAKAEARVAAEIEVRRMSPKDWLRMGPGRLDPEGTGETWADPKVDVNHSGGVANINVNVDGGNLENFSPEESVQLLELALQAQKRKQNAN